MTTVSAPLRAVNSTISIVVTRADGTVEDLGVVSYKDANPFKTLGWYLAHPRQASAKCKRAAARIFNSGATRT
jgi:hypothetical protein